MNNKNRPDHVQLFTEGEACMEEVLSILESWPDRREYGRRLDFRMRSAADKQRIHKAQQRLKDWIEELARQRALHDEVALGALSKIVEFALTDEFYNENALDDARSVKEGLLRLVESMPIVNRLQNGSCSCIAEPKPAVRQFRNRPQPRLYRQRNPVALRKA
jgi:hypothetical protein